MRLVLKGTLFSQQLGQMLNSSSIDMYFRNLCSPILGQTVKEAITMQLIRVVKSLSARSHRLLRLLGP